MLRFRIVYCQRVERASDLAPVTYTNPKLSAFCRSEPTLRFVSLVILATGVFAFECARNSLTSALVYSRRTTVFFEAILRKIGNCKRDWGGQTPTISTLSQALATGMLPRRGELIGRDKAKAVPAST